MSLSKLQQTVVDIVLKNTNIFFTGSAGCGKSYILQYIIKLLPISTTFVTAFTGAAATKICGTTFNSWAGIGLGNGTKEEILCKLGRQGRWNITVAKTLIIDEVSMISADLFDKVEWIAQQVRDNDLPFGGIHLILSGDFYQIPPINKKIQADDPDVKLLFESESFKKCIIVIIELDEIFRQSDPKMIDMLNDVRHNQCKPETIALLDSLKRPLDFKDGILPTKLFCKNIDVDQHNLTELRLLKGQEYKYESQDNGQEPFKTQMDTHCIRPRTLRLKVGAQVMILVNDKDDRRLVNGSRGVVVKFDDKLPVVQFVSGIEKKIVWDLWKLEDRKSKVLASRYQIPLKLAWCMTVHKSQGMTIDRLEVKIDDAFDYGIAYVALSRATTLDGLCVKAYCVRKFRINPKVRKFYKQIHKTI